MCAKAFFCLDSVFGTIFLNGKTTGNPFTVCNEEHSKSAGSGILISTFYCRYQSMHREFVALGFEIGNCESEKVRACCCSTKKILIKLRKWRNDQLNGSPSVSIWLPTWSSWYLIFPYHHWIMSAKTLALKPAMVFCEATLSYRNL